MEPQQPGGSRQRKKRRGLRVKGDNPTRAQIMRSLEREVAARQQQCDELLCQHEGLWRRHSVLVACCDGLGDLMRQSTAEVAGRIWPAAGAGGDAEEEVALLDQLRRISYSGESLWGPACGSQEAEEQVHETIAPPSDAMRYFRQIISKPPFPGAEQLSIEQLAAHYSRLIRDLALHLHHLGRPPFQMEGAADKPSAQERIVAAIDRHLHLMATLVLLGRTDLMQRFVLLNCETLESMEEPDVGRTHWALQQVGLTPQQKERIADGHLLFDRMLEPVMRERHQLQQELAAAGPSAQAKQRLERLEVVLRKEYLLRLAATSWTVGCFTWAQMARLAVPMAPFTICLPVVSALLAEERARSAAVAASQATAAAATATMVQGSS